MANIEHVEILEQGTEVWNAWRERNPGIRPDFRDMEMRDRDLSGADLHGADFTSEDEPSDRFIIGPRFGYLDFDGYRGGADLRGCNLSDANLCDCDLSEADLTGCDLGRASLDKANLRRAFLIDADLCGARIRDADLRQCIMVGAKLASDVSFHNMHLGGGKNDLGTEVRIAADLTNSDLSGSDLSYATLVECNLSGSDLSGCSVYGISAWGLTLDNAVQHDLTITPPNQPTITVDNIEVAQFLYLMLDNDRMRDAIGAIVKRGVLILGRFSGRMHILDAVRHKLRQLGYLPMLFDFERPAGRDFTETVMTLVGLSRFVIADLTNPRSVPLELEATVPKYMIPFVPIIEKGEPPFSMLEDLQRKHSWVLPPLVYSSVDDLLETFEHSVIQCALAKQAEIGALKSTAPQSRRTDDYRLLAASTEQEEGSSC